MPTLYTSGEIANIIARPKKATRFHESRVRKLIVNGLIVPDDKTEGGHLRFSGQYLAMAAVYSAMLDADISHTAATSPQGFDESAFVAAQFAMTFHHRGRAGKIDRSKDTPESGLAWAAANPNTITRAMNGVAKGEWWVLRIDHMRDDQTGAKRFLAVAYEQGQPAPECPMPKRKSETPAMSFLIPLNPILLPIVADRSGAN
ncbi:MAG: hypothetical protein ACK4M6_02130 [Hyphomonas sp.]